MRVLEDIQAYKGCDIMIYKNNDGTRSYCWGNLCWKNINEVKSEINKMGA